MDEDGLTAADIEQAVMTGAIVAILGVVDALFAPRLLRKKWEEEDRQKS